MCESYRALQDTSELAIERMWKMMSERQTTPKKAIGMMAYPLVNRQDEIFRPICKWEYFQEPGNPSKTIAVLMIYSGRHNIRHFIYANNPSTSLSVIASKSVELCEHDDEYFKFVIEQDGLTEKHINEILMPNWQPKASATTVYRMVFTREKFKQISLPSDFDFSTRELTESDYPEICLRLKPGFSHFSVRREILKRRKHLGLYHKGNLIGMIGIIGPYETGDTDYPQVGLLIDFVISQSFRGRNLGPAINSILAKDYLERGAVLVGDAQSFASRVVAEKLGADVAATYLWCSYRRVRSGI